MCGCTRSETCNVHANHDERRLANIANAHIAGLCNIDMLIRAIFLMEGMRRTKPGIADL